jgi:hypothetical protein
MNYRTILFLFFCLVLSGGTGFYAHGRHDVHNYLVDKNGPSVSDARAQAYGSQGLLPLRRGCRWPRYTLKINTVDPVFGKATFALERFVSPLFSIEANFSYLYDGGSAMGLATDHYKEYKDIPLGYSGGIRFIHPFYARRPKAFFKRSHLVYGYYHEYIETGIGVTNIAAPIIGYGARFAIFTPLYFEINLEAGPRVWAKPGNEPTPDNFEIGVMLNPRIDLCLIIF